MKNNLLVSVDNIRNRIYTVRNVQVMPDYDLAAIYQVETKVFNQAVKRNIDRFPPDFRFQLSEDEYRNLRSQIVTSSVEHGGRRYLPYVFTEQGIAMLSAVLRSDVAIKISIQIMQAFVEMRKLISSNSIILQRLDAIETKQLKTDEKLSILFKAMEKKDSNPEQGVFFDGQVFDSYVFVAKLVREAKQSLVLIDNYIDESVLTLLSKKRPEVKLTILTKSVSKSLKIEIARFNEQYAGLVVLPFSKSHDRFLILDGKVVYHLGASLKDLGKKWFAFSRMDKTSVAIIKILQADNII